MKTKIFVVIVALIIIGAFIYFGNFADENTVDETPDTGETTLPADGTSPINQGALIDEKSENYEISGRYANENLLGSSAVNLYVNDYIESFKSQADEDVPGLRDQDSAIEKYTLDIDTVSYAGIEYVFHVLTIGEYTGGASTNAVIQTFAYRVEDGLAVDLKEFVDENQKADFMKTLKEKLLAHGEDSDDGVGVFEDVVADLKFEDIRAFYFQNEEIIVLFSKYEVAPGAAGIIRISIPLSDL